MRGKTTFVLFLLVLTLIPFVSAAPPVLSTVQAGSLEIIAPTYEVVKAGLDKDIYWHVFNTSTLLTNTTTTCAYHLYEQNLKGEHIVTVAVVKGFTNDRDFEVEVKGANFTVGRYCQLIECNTTTQTGGIERCFEVSATLSDNTTLIIFLFLVGLVLLVLGYAFKNEFFGLFAGMLLTASGVYTMIYGIAAFNDVWTRFIASVVLGAGLMIIFAAMFEIIKGREHDGGLYEE